MCPKRTKFDPRLARMSLLKVMDEFKSHPATSLFWGTALLKGEDNNDSRSDHDEINFLSIRGKVYDNCYKSLESWRNDCMSVFSMLESRFDESTPQRAVIAFCRDLFHRICLKHGVDGFSRWSDRIYKYKLKLNRQMSVAPSSMKPKNGVKPRRANDAEKNAKIGEIANATRDFKDPSDWTDVSLILVKAGIIPGDTQSTIDLMNLKSSAINEIYEEMITQELIK